MGLFACAVPVLLAWCCFLSLSLHYGLEVLILKVVVPKGITSASTKDSCCGLNYYFTVKDKYNILIVFLL